MAWPSTPLRTYVAGTTPTIKAADLNSIQGTINDVINGDVTAVSLQVDGTGAAVATAAAGELRASGYLTGYALRGTGTIGSAVKGAAMNNTGGAGDGTVTATGSNVAGLLTVVTGAAVNAASGQTITAISFGITLSAAPAVDLYPGNALAADMATWPYVETTTSTLTIKIGATPLVAGGGAGGTYVWHYKVAIP